MPEYKVRNLLLCVTKATEREFEFQHFALHKFARTHTQTHTFDMGCKMQFHVVRESENADVIDKLRIKCVVTEFIKYTQTAYNLITIEQFEYSQCTLCTH